MSCPGGGGPSGTGTGPNPGVKSGGRKCTGMGWSKLIIGPGGSKSKLMNGVARGAPPGIPGGAFIPGGPIALGIDEGPAITGPCDAKFGFGNNGSLDCESM